MAVGAQQPARVFQQLSAPRKRSAPGKGSVSTTCYVAHLFQQAWSISLRRIVEKTTTSSVRGPIGIDSDRSLYTETQEGFGSFLLKPVESYLPKTLNIT